MEKPDTITVTVSRREEVEANKVDIQVTIKGSSLVTGTAALKKAKEVAQLVSALAEVGLKDERVTLKGIHAASSSGMLGRSTSATYQLHAWRYPDDKKLKNDWLQACLNDANEKAKAVASILGVKLKGGVHTFVEKWLDGEQGDRRLPQEVRVGDFMKMARTRGESIDLGFPLSHSKWVELQLEAQFRVSELTQ